MAGGLHVARDPWRGRGGWVAKAVVSALASSAAWGSWQPRRPGFLPQAAFAAKRVRVKKPNVPPPADTCSPVVPRELRPPIWYQVWFAESSSVERAVEELDGFGFAGQPLFVTPSTENAAVNAQGYFRSSLPQDVLELFEQVGQVVDIQSYEDGRYGEVRFKTADDAWNAREQMDGTVLYGKRLRVEVDCSTHHMNKVLVHGLSREVMWQELKDHFMQVGQVEFATVHGGMTARIVYDSGESAALAAKRLNKFKLNNYGLNVGLPWDSTEENTVVRVRGLPPDVTADVVRRHFEVCGTIEDLSISVEEMPPEFCQ